MKPLLKRRAVLPAAAALLLIILLTAWLWRAAGPGQDRIWQEIQTSGQWRVGLDPSFPPFEMLDAAGQPVGFDVDLARAIAARWGVTVTFEALGFDGLVDAVYTGRLQGALSALPYQSERTQDVAFSDPYFEAGLALALPMTNSALQSPDDLAGRRVAVEWGSEGDVQARALRRRFTDLTLLPQDTPQAALLAVAEGQADAALVDRISALQFMAGDTRLRLASQVIVSDPYSVVLPRKSARLRREVNAALAALRADGTLDALTARWFSSGSGP